MIFGSLNSASPATLLLFGHRCSLVLQAAGFSGGSHGCPGQSTLLCLMKIRLQYYFIMNKYFRTLDIIVLHTYMEILDG